jgi:hypothetical protein
VFCRDFLTLARLSTRHVLQVFVGLARFDLSLMKWDLSNSWEHVLHFIRHGGEGGKFFFLLLFGGGWGARWDGIRGQIMWHTTGFVVMAAFTSS